MSSKSKRTTFRRMMAMFLAVTTMLSMLVFPAAAAPANTQPEGYVTDNLVLWLDVNNNTGTGTHDSKATQWVNLVNTDQKIALNGQKWGEGEDGYYLDFTDNYIKLPDEVRQALAGENFTIEFVLDDFDSATGKAKCIMNTIGDDAWITAGGATSVVNDNFVIFQNASGGNSTTFCFRTCSWNGSGWSNITDGKPDYAKVSNTSALTDVTQTLTFDHDGKSVWYQDGVATASAANTGRTISMDGFKVNGTWQTERKPQVVFGAPNGLIGGRYFDGNVKAIRVYKDNLTADEIAKNALRDQQYYFNGDTAVPAGYTTDGLVLFLDANNNTGAGYSASATQWTNLANLDQAVALNGQTWGDDADYDSHYLDFSDNYLKLPDNVRKAIASGEFTIEFVMDGVAVNSNATQNIMTLTGSDSWIKTQVEAGTKLGGSKNDNFVIYQNAWESTVNFKINSDSKPRAQLANIGNVNGVTNAITFKLGSKANWNQDAKVVSTSNDTYTKAADIASWDGTTPQVLFGAATDVVNSRAFNANVKAVRIYNKALTAEQLAANSSADKANYYSTKEPTIAVPEGYVTDNLVMFLDANLNTGVAYDKTATEWVDLTDATGETKVKTNGNTWGTSEYNTGYLVMENNYILLPDKVRQAIEGTEFTVEFIMEDFNGEPEGAIKNVMCVTGDDAWIASMKAAGTKGAVVNDNFVLFMNQSGGGQNGNLCFRTCYGSSWSWIFDAYAQVKGTELSDVTSTITFKSGGKSCWYVDGAQVSTATNNSNTVDLSGFKIDGTWQTERKPQVAFGAASDTISSRVFSGKVKAIRIYSDVLTQAEAAQNAAMDNARYYTDPSADHTHQWETEWTQTATEHYYACKVEGCDAKRSYGPHNYTNDDDASCNTCGYTRAIKSIVASFDVDVYEPVTDVNTAPIIMQKADADTADVSGEAKRPSAVVYDLKLENGVLTAYAYKGTAKLGAFADLYAANFGKANIGVRLTDMDTATALANWASTERVGNLWVISNDVEQIDKVTDAMGTIRGVVDFTGDTVRGPANIKFNFDTDGDGTVEDKVDASNPNKIVGGEMANNAKRTYDWKTYTKGNEANVYANMAWSEVYDLIFAEGYRTILIPEEAGTKDHIYFLQGSLVYTILESDASTDVEYFDLIASGANGVLAPDYAAYIDVLEGDVFDVNGENTLVRGGSIVGHRGDMGYHVKGQLTLPENSVESIISSAQAGASSVEFDMYLTLDGELVLNHNASVAGYFEYGPDTPDNITRVADSVGITSRYWYGDMEYLVSTYNKEIPMQRLQDLYEAVDTEWPELRLHHEIKDSRIETLNRTIEMMDKYGLRDRSDMMCFTYSTVAYTNSMGVSSQYLSTPSSKTTPDRIYKAEESYRPINSTWHTTWGNIDTDYLEQLKHFGQTAYPWATNSGTNGGYYEQGYQGFTTDAPHHTDDYIRELVINFDKQTGVVTATASTLADHQKGTEPSRSQFVDSSYEVVTLPDYLQDYWVDKGYSHGKREYVIDDGLEIVVLDGEENITIADNTITRKANQSGEATIAVRYLQNWNGGQFYYYSVSQEIVAPLYDHEHTFDQTWESSETHHWHPCMTPGCMTTDPADLADRNGYAEHVYSNADDATCDCGYTRIISKVVDGYVEDGLVLFLDAIDNVATGSHSSTATSWVNLANTAQQVAIPNGSTVKGAWGEDAEHDAYYLDLDGYIKLPETVRQAIASGKFTIEFLMDYEGDPQHTAGGIANVMALTGSDRWIAATTTKGATPNDNFVIYQYNGSNVIRFKTNSTPSEGGRVQVAGGIDNVTQTITHNSGAVTWYQGTIAKSTANTYNSAPSVASFTGAQTGEVPQVIFGAAIDTVKDRAFGGKIKAIRIYDRVLTADEMAANADMDQIRYCADPDNAGIPDGYETDGLVLFLDGINNTGAGVHSAGSKTWTNLVKPSEKATFLSGGSNSYAWTEDGLTVNGGVILPASALAAVDGSNFTVEFYVENYDSTIHESVTRNILVLIGPDGNVAGSGGGVWDDDFVSFQNSTAANSANDDLWCFDIKNDDHAKFGRISVAAASINQVTNAITFDKTKSVSWLQDGVSKSTQSGGASANWSTGIDLTNGTRLLFGAASGHMSNRAFAGEIKAIRIYNRTLTADELKANATADMIRYEGLDLDALAQESWNNVVGHTGALDTNTTLAGIQAYANAQLAAAAVKVEVADAGNGAFTFTYKDSTNDKVLDTHTLYVDTEYTLDMSELTAAQKDAVLNDMVEFVGRGTIATKWDDTAKAINYAGTRPGGANPVSHLYFPVYSSGEEYVFEAEIGFVSGGGGWSTMAFAAEDFVEHLQYAFWGTLGETSTAAEFVRFQDPDKNSGTFAVGHVNIPFTNVLDAMGDSWKDVYTYTEKDGKGSYNVTDTIKFKVIAYEGVLYGFINDVQVLSTVATGSIAKDFNGVFGFNTANTSMNIHAISVRPITEANAEEELDGVELTFNPVKAFNVDIYEPDTDINAAPIVMQSATAATADLSGEAKRPSALIYTVKAEDGVLNAYEGETLIGAFADLYDANHKKANVGVRIAMGDKATAEALLAWILDNGAGNLWVISADVELLNIITAEAGTVRGVVDFTGDAVRGPANIKFNFDTNGDGTVADKDGKVNGEMANRAKRTFDYVTYESAKRGQTVYAGMEWSDIYDLVFALGYRTVLLDEADVTKDHVHFLQGSLVNVIVETEAAAEADFYSLITTGVNGILSTAYDVNIAALESDLFDVNGENILVRGGSIVGHRGDMGNAVKGGKSLPENSVESIVSSAQSGASSVEFDMYMTLDGELVLNHNASIAGYFTYGPNTPDNITRVADSVGITSRYWYGDLEYMVSTYNPEIPLQRLYQLYEAVDTEYPELRLHHEIKDGRIENLNRTIELMDQYGLRGRSDMMCFTYSVVEYTNSMGISSQYLSTPSSYATENRIYAAEISYRPINSTWHTTWGNINPDYLEELKHFGQTAYPWATYSNTWAGYYVQGYQGFTTDAPHHTDDAIRELIPVIDYRTGKIAVTARTLAYHNEGVFSNETPSGEAPITLPDYLQNYWVDKGYSDGIREYDLADFEIIAIAGNPDIDNETKSVGGVKGDMIAVRYKQTLTESDGQSYSFYIYSEAVPVVKPGSGALKYSIEVEDFENGTAYTDLNAAAPGTLVTITAKADEGYELAGLTVTDSNGNAIKVTETADGKYTFVMPNKAVSIAPVFAESGDAHICPSEKYDDVDTSLWYHEAIDYVVANGLMTGVADDTFAPNVTTTRGMIVTILYSLEGKPAVSGDAFDDVNKGDWYFNAVNWAAANGIVAGYGEGKFGPNDNVTREQLVAILKAYANYKGADVTTTADLSKFSDADAVSAWAVEAVKWGVGSGIISGKPADILDPTGNALRCEVAQMMLKFTGLI